MRTGDRFRFPKARSSVGRDLDLHQAAAILRRMVDPDAPISDLNGHARPRDAWRFSYHRSHLARRLHSGRQPRRKMAHRARRKSGGLQLLWRASRQSRSDGTRHLANIRLRNQLAPGTEGGWTSHIPSGEKMFIYDASVKYQAEGVPLMILAGKEYGSGSSRDWAAKGVLLLGVNAVIAESFERIHRSNLVGMGVLPCSSRPGQNRESLGLTGQETFSVTGSWTPSIRARPRRHRRSDDGSEKQFEAIVRIDTPAELEYYRSGGILPYVLRQVAQGGQSRRGGSAS